MDETRDKISVLSILLHGLFLVSLNLFSVIVAFAAMQTLYGQSDRLAQGIIALLVSFFIYFVVFRFMFGIQKEIMQIDNYTVLIIVLLVSLALLPAVFYPLHFLTQGTWSSIDNLYATWPFQLIVNGFCLFFNFHILSEK